MALAPSAVKLNAILDAIGSEMSRRGAAVADPSAAPAQLEVRREEEVRRLIQVYWTPFQATIPGVSVGLHLNIDKPTKHWVEAYISPTSDSWIFCFHERAVDGEYQLAYYRQQSDPLVAVEEFFDLAGWYALTACDLTWGDVKASINDDLGWSEEDRAAITGGEMDKAIQESLKKSTIVWLRWTDSNGTEQTMPVWFIIQDSKMYFVSGERQQTVPGIRDIRKAHVVLRWKGRGNARVADLPVSVKVLDQGPEWDAAAEKLAEKRLNTPGAPEDLASRWRDDCDIVQLSF